jgi:hypothetical protein
MKPLHFILLPLYLITVYANSGYAQTVQSRFRTTDAKVNLEEKADSAALFLFRKFNDAVIYYPNEFANLKVAYRILNDEMIALHPNGNIMAINPNRKFDSIVVEDRVYIYHAKFGYLEKISGTKSPFYIRMQGSYTMNEIVVGAYGSTPASAATKNYNSIDSKHHTRMNIDPTKNIQNSSGNEVEFVVESAPVLGVVRDNTFEAIQTRRDILRLFPMDASKVRGFLRSENISFDNRVDLIKLAIFIENY